MTIRVDRLLRYPIKGCPAERVGSAVLVPGSGLPFDRELAVANGDQAIPRDGRWCPSPTFARLTTHPELLRTSVALDPARRVVRWEHPEHGAVVVALDDIPSPAVDHWLRQWLTQGRHGGPELVRARYGFWDDQEGTVSLINLASIEALSRACDRSVDPRRFRGNVYLRGLPPWREFDLVGRRLRIGTAEVRILHPINRCRATSVAPGPPEPDLHPAAELMRRFGHIYCGLRAEVRIAGRIEPGSEVEVLPDPPAPVLPSAGLPVEQWPRPATIVARVPESANAVSLWLRDPLYSIRSAPTAGQHLRVHVQHDGGPLWRCYTISGSRADQLRITVKQDPVGRVSRALHELTVGDTLLVSGPHGDTILGDEDGPLLLAGAGIGITQTRTLAAHALRHRPDRQVLLVHTARRASELALWDETRTLLARYPNATTRLFLTDPRPGDLQAVAACSGRPSVGRVGATELALGGATAYLCGPPSFMESARAELLAQGLPDRRVHQETFASPDPDTRPELTPPHPGPFRITFAASGRVVEWTADDGTLLDLAEAHGMAAPAGCRAGACHLCRQPVTRGAVAHPRLPVAPRPGSALLCCAVPTSDLSLPL